MRTRVLIFALVLSTGIFAQVSNTSRKLVFLIDNFSDLYYGKVQIDDTSEVFSPGWVAIIDRKSNKELLRVSSEELALNLHDGEAMANIREIPYGEQSLIMYDDFNFDGKKDFAISDGQNSCYHGPSFRIYLASLKGFLYNKDFTRLAQEYCGMFDVDWEKKRISTMSKSGCCWHQFTEFMIVNNSPKEILKITEDYAFPFRTTTEETWNGKIMVKKSVKTMNPLDVDVVLSFQVPKNGKQVMLYNLNDRMLYYALLRKDSTVEFSYPLEAVYQNPDFRFDNSAGNMSVSFKNKDASYKVYEKGNEIGITISVNRQVYHWVGLPASKEGSLDKLGTLKLDNVVSSNE